MTRLRAPPCASTTARRLWYDTVGHGHVPALRAAAATFGADRPFLGTDFPYEAGDLFRTAVSFIEHAGLPDDRTRRMLDDNARIVLRAAP